MNEQDQPAGGGPDTPGGQGSAASPTAPIAPQQAQQPPGGAVSIGPGGAVRAGRAPLQITLGPAGILPGPFRPVRGGAVLTTPFGRVVSGTVGSVSGSGFTVKGPAGRTVTVTEQSSTVYRKAGGAGSKSMVTRARVAVLGSLSGSKMPAILVAVLSG